MTTYIDILNYAINALLYFYLLDNKKKLSPKQLLVIISISLLIGYITINFLYSYLLQKNLFMFACFIFGSLSVYKLPIKTVLFKYFVYIILSLFTELLGILFFHNYVQNGIFHMTFTTKVIFVIFLNSCIFLFIKIYYYFINEANNHKKFKLPSVTMLAIMFISALLGIFNSFSVLKYYETLKPLQNYLYILLFTTWFILIIILLRQFKVQLSKIKEELLISKYNEEYQKRLLSLVKEENDEYHARLRHDIINYIQTKQTMDKNK